MADALEHDLARMLADEAAAVDVPAVPPTLRQPVAGAGDEPSGQRPRLLLAMVAAVVLVAIAVPFGILRGDDGELRPDDQPDVVPDRRPALDLAYLAGGTLRTGDVTVPTGATALEVGGDEVLVETSGANGSTTWDRLVGRRLAPVPYLDDAVAVALSLDGDLVAAVTGGAPGDTIEVRRLATGELVDRFAIGEPVWESMRLEGFDSADRLYWHDAAAPRMWRPDGTVTTFQVEGWVGLAPTGPIMWDGLGERAELTRVAANGSLVVVGEVPVSGEAAWRPDGVLAYRDRRDDSIHVRHVASGRDERVPGGPWLRLLGWSGSVVVVTEQTADGEDVVTVDPVTGERRQVATLGPDDPGFPALGGTGIL